MSRRVLPILAALAVVGVVVVGFAGFGFGRAEAAQAGASENRSLEVVSLQTEAELRPDGSMVVTEHVTYRFEGGPFRQGLRTFEREDLSRIVGFRVDEDGLPLTVIGPPESEIDGWAWDFPSPVSDSTHTYVLRYEVPDAVTVGSDVGELYWQFLGRDHDGVGAVAVEIALPGSFPTATDSTPDDDADVVRAWGHGPDNGVVTVASDRVTLVVDDVPSRTFVEARVAIPRQAFTVTPTGGERLPTILQEEREFIESGQRDESRRSAGGWLAIITAVMGGAGTVALWSRFGREPKVPWIGTYWREPLEDPPAVVLATLSRGTVAPSQSMASTIVDLAQRGHLTIAEEVVERFGPDKRFHRFTRREPRRPDPLAPFEQALLSYVFADGDTITTEEIEDRAKHDRSGSEAFLERWKHLVGQAYKAREYGDPGGVPQRWWMLAIVALVMIAAGVIALALGNMLGLVPLIAVVPVVGGGALLLRNRSTAGAEATAKAKGLRSFLRDFSNLKDAPSGHLILWERYLVYAVTLGVSKQLLAGLASRMPQLMADPAFGAWYVGTAGSRLAGLPGFPGAFESTAMSGISPPSSSGAGGGFSGGGGGGGGGGGFGAR